MTKEQVKKLQEFALEIRIGTVECIKSRGFGHIGGSLSVADLLAVLYGEVMNVDPSDPKKPDRDKLVCSKGHAGPAVYATLALKGYFPYEKLFTLNQPGTDLPSHCDRKKTPGVDMTTGSLGQGFSVAAGMAMAGKLDKDPGRVYAVLGDGELQEGLVWEAAMSASHYGLDNLVAIVDHNGLQIDGRNDDVMKVNPIGAKFEGFGWNVIEIDGHDMQQILDAFAKARDCKGKPTVIVAETTKGKGVSFMEDQAGWHGKAPNDEQTQQAIEELEAAKAAL